MVGKCEVQKKKVANLDKDINILFFIKKILYNLIYIAYFTRNFLVGNLIFKRVFVDIYVIHFNQFSKVITMEKLLVTVLALEYSILVN